MAVEECHVELSRVKSSSVLAVGERQVMLCRVMFGQGKAVRLSRVELRNVVDRQGSYGERRTNNEEIFLE